MTPLLSIAAGHLVGVAAVAGGVPLALQLRLALDARWLLVAGVVALPVLAVHRCVGRERSGSGALWQAGVGAWSFLMGLVHGAGIALLPVLAPLCSGSFAGTEALLPALLSVLIHIAAMSGVVMLLSEVIGRVLHSDEPWLRRMSRKENTTMADDKSQSQGQDRQRINVHQDYELRDWAKSLNTTPERLKEAVQAVGDRAEKVREYLSNDKPR